jgi:CRP-like cAMP-binding protein
VGRPGKEAQVERKRLGRDGPERLGKIDVLAGLSIGQRRMLAGMADEATAAAGEELMRQGESGFEVLMIEDGSADVLQDGRLINTVGPGDLCGELAVLGDGSPRTASVVATSDVRAIVLTAHFMRELRQRMPDVGAQIDAEAAAHLERDAQAG